MAQVKEETAEMYSRLVQQLFKLNTQKAMKLGVDHVAALSELIGAPHKAFKSVHIAGTNGPKGFYA